MNLGEILDRTVQIYRERFLAFVGLAALPALAMTVIQLAGESWFHVSSTGHAKGGHALGWSAVESLGLYHISAFLSLLVMPALVQLASSVVLSEKSSMRLALNFNVARWRSYLWIVVLKLSAQLLIPEIVGGGLFLAIAVALNAAGAFDKSGGQSLLPFFLVVPFLAGIALFFWIGAFLALTIPCGALETIAGTKALRRSWTLSRDSRVRIMIAWALVATISLILMLVLNLVWRGVFAFGARVHLSWMIGNPLYPKTILYFAAAALIGPIYPIALTLFYYDQRMRREGYDIERMMEAAGMTASQTLPAQEAAPAVEDASA